MHCLRAHGLAIVLAAFALTLSIVAWALLQSGYVSGQGVSASAEPYPDSLPRLRTLRTLSGPHEGFPLIDLVAGAIGVAWSSDGQRVATFMNGGAQLMVSSPDGAVSHVSPRYHAPWLGWRDVLGFLSGRREVLTNPAIPEQTNPLTAEAQNIAMSVLDAETGKVLRNIPGPRPGGKWQDNIVQKFAISPDQKLVATANNFDRLAEHRVRIYSTDNWRLLTELSFGGSHSLEGAEALAFSPDGSMLAIGYMLERQQIGRVDIFDVGSWMLKRTIDAFPERAPPQAWPDIGHVSFSHDDSLILVVSESGGMFWKYPNGLLAPPGEGAPTPDYPAEPIRVFKIADGTRIAAGGGTVGSVWPIANIAWSPTRNLIAFVDDGLMLNLWDPTASGHPQAVQKLERATTAIAFSPDGTMLGQAFGEGVRLFQVVNNH
jgi:WD40 repeat protein